MKDWIPIWIKAALYYWYVPGVIAIYTAQAWLSVKTQAQGGWWGFWMWLCTIIPIWIVVTRLSTNLMFDGLVFDITLTLTYTLALMYFTNSFSHFGLNQYLGVLLILIGMFVFKKGV